MDPNDLTKLLNALSGAFSDQNKDFATSSSLIDILSAAQTMLNQEGVSMRPPLQPTLYGIDFKITANGDVKLIEANGAKSGSGGFRDIYGDDRVKEDIVQRMRKIAGEKKIVLTGSYSRSRKDHFSRKKEERRKSPLVKRLWWWYTSREQQMIVKQLTDSKSNRSISEEEIAIDKENYEHHWNGQFLDAELFDKRVLADAFFLHDTDTMRFLYTKDSDRIARIDAAVLGADGEPLVYGIDGQAIGLFWDRHGRYFGPMFPGFALVNPPHHRVALQNKLYVHHLLSKSSMANSLIPSIPLGCGIETQEQFDAFLEDNQDEIFVLKPITGSRGYGVRMVPRSEIEQERVGMPINNWTSIEHAWARLPIGGLDFLNHGIELLSPYIYSKRVHADTTGQDHDGCIRAIVFNGEFIDAYWRLAPEPIDSTTDELEQRLRANRSRGGISQALTDDEKEIAKGFSEAIATQLDESLYTYHRFNPYGMENDFWLEMLGAKHEIEEPTKKKILRAAKSKRQELGMGYLTTRHIANAQVSLVGGSLGLGVTAIYQLLQYLF